LPPGVRVSQGIVSKAGGKSHIALNKAESNDAGVAVVREGAGGKPQAEKGYRANKKKKSVRHGKPLSDARVYKVRR
jgi:hypothetical protein